MTGCISTIAVTTLVINLALGLTLKMIVVHLVKTWPYQKTLTSTRKYIRYWKVATLEQCGLVCTGMEMISLSRWVASSMLPTQTGTQKSQIMVEVFVMKIASSWWTWYIGHLITVRLRGNGMMLHALIQDVILSVNSSYKPNCNFSSIKPSIL